MLESVLVRRLKDDIREIVGGFPKRHVEQVDVDGLPEDAPELRLSALLDEYRRLREVRLKNETRRKQAASGLLIIGLQQRLLSSVEAFARTLYVHRRTVQREWERMQKHEAAAQSGSIRFDLLTESIDSDDDRATLTEEQLDAEVDTQIEAASAESVGPADNPTAAELFRKEQQLLDEMTEIAETARGRPDARVRKLIDWIRDNMCSDLGRETGLPAEWNNIRVIIFTEWDDTKRYLQQQIEAAIAGTDRANERIAIYHGPTPPEKREEIKKAFQNDPVKYPVRILIATDAAREGLNLQAHCWNLFHFDVPWNPSRMEQRNGRIDRKLQEHDVYCRYFVYKQRPEDRVLQALVRKTETIKQELGSLSQVIDTRLRKSLAAGIQRDRVDTLEREIDTADLDADEKQTMQDELEASRERQDALRSQIDRLRTLLDNSQKSIGLSEDQFRSAISCSLQLAGAEPLQSAAAGGDWKGPPQFAFPSLDQREGADPTWVETMDTLRVPRERSQKPWEWRRKAQVRPVVFEDPGVVTDDVVHLHLEHRVVQRLLGRFSAQGFVHHDLSRACLAQSADAVPRVVLLSRLCLYGPGAARLHEELIPVTARWVDPAIRKDVLAPYARETEIKTLALLEESLIQRDGKTVADTVQQQLQAASPRDVQELLPHLQSRGEEYAKDAQAKLAQRAEAEAKAMQDILDDQKKHIAATVKAHERRDWSQLRLRFDGDELDDPAEQRQLEANKRYWSQRLEMIDGELHTEPQRIRDVYEVQARRIEPVGLVYLWPVTG
jgi:hypothetical protein